MKKTAIQSMMILNLVLATLLGISGTAGAALTTIGTATYEGSDYNLIWDDDNNGNSVVWLDYSNDKAKWSVQVSWAASLGDELTINLYDRYMVTWDGDWRLPSTVDGFSSVTGYNGTTTAGYNITSSEMGHLYYEELSNLGLYDTSGNEQAVYGLTDTGDFENLNESWYWSGTKYGADSSNAWWFNMKNGCQIIKAKKYTGYGLALRNGQVSVSAVPVPSAVWLLGSGLFGILGLQRRK